MNVHSQQQIDYSKESSEGEINLQELLHNILSYKWTLLFITLATFSAAFFYIHRLPNIYQATTTMVIDEGRGADNQVGNLLNAFSGGGQQELDTHLEILRSYSFAQKVVSSLELHYIDEFKYHSRDENWNIQRRVDLPHTIDVFRSNLSLSSLKNTNLVKISFESEEPSVTAMVTNEIASLFIQQQELSNAKSNDDTFAWINSSVAELKSQVEQSEEKLQDFLKNKNLVDLRSQLELEQQEIATLSKEIMQTEKRQAEISIVQGQIKAANGDISRLMQISAIGTLPLVSELRRQFIGLQKEQSELEKRYLEKHPKMISVVSRLDSAKAELEQILQQSISSLEQEMLFLQQSQQKLEARIDIVKADYRKFVEKELHVSKLMQEVESNKKLFESFLLKQKESQLFREMNTKSVARVVDPAVTPRLPIKPRRTLLYAASLVGSVLLALILVLLFHHINDSVRIISQSLDGMSVPVIAQIPKLPTFSKNNKVPINAKKGRANPSFLESIRTLLTHILIQQKQVQCQIIAITSANANEGKSSISLNLAQSFGEIEKTLLIDGDLRFPSIAEALGLDKTAPGLTNLIAGSNSLRECLVRNVGLGVDVITSGTKPRNPLVFLSRPRLGQIIRSLAKHYDRIIIECPPANSVSDVMVISRVVDSVVLVVDVEQTQQEDVLHVTKRLREAGVMILGAVLNKVSNRRDRYYYQEGFRSKTFKHFFKNSN